MDIVYSLGISSLWDEVRHMPVGGVWWLNVDRHADAVSLLNHTLASQDKKSQVAAIVMGDNPKEIISLEKSIGPEKVALFTMPNRVEGLEEMHRDLVCSLEPGNYLFCYVPKTPGRILKVKNYATGLKNHIDGLIIIVVHY